MFKSRGTGLGRCAILVGAALSAVFANGADAGVLTTDVDGLEVLYGGITGDTFEEAPYDFGTSFGSVSSAALRLVGVTDVAGSKLTFTASLDGIDSPSVPLLTTTNQFQVVLPLLAGPGLLDGTGLVGLNIETTLVGGADLASSVTEAVLVVDGVAVGVLFSGCGTIVQGVECPLFAADAGGLYVLSNLGPYTVGDDVFVTGVLDPNCITFCQQGNGCILNNTIAPCCRGDVNGDGVVNITDVLIVLLDWGCTDPPGPCPGDANGDGMVNITDLILVLLNWGDCPQPLGRCCFTGIIFPPYGCTVNTEAECDGFVESFWAEGETCDTAPCDPAGRCCLIGFVFPPYICLETIESDCNGIGAFWEEGLNCTDDPCPDPEPLGRCCFTGIVFPPYLCTVNTEAECAGFIGSFWEEGETCDSAPCNTDCLFPCPLDQECFTGCGTIIQGVECPLFLADAGGLYVLSDLGGFNVGDSVFVTGCIDPNCITICQQGNGCILNNTIEPCTEPLGRCCFTGIVFPPYLCMVNTEAECAGFIGSFWDEGLNCDEDPCLEPLGRCCFVGIVPGFLCEVTTEAECEGFVSSSWTAGLTCDTPCEDACVGIVCTTGGPCFSGCGSLVEGVECVLFQADSGGLYVINTGGFSKGARVHVTGCIDPNCITTCQQGNGCIFNSTIQQCGPPSS